MRNHIAHALLMVTSVAALGLGYHQYPTSADPDVPTWFETIGRERVTSTVLRQGPLAEPQKIRGFNIGGLRLGMPAEDAINKLMQISSNVRVRPNARTRDPRSIIGRAAWTELAYASSPVPVAIGLKTPFSTTNYISLGSSIWPDGRERLTTIELVVQSPIFQDEISRTTGQSPMDTIISLIESRLGKPTVEGQSTHTGEYFVTYGSDRVSLTDIDALFTYVRCTNLGAPVSDDKFKCNRRKAIRSPWLQIFGRAESFSLRLQDGNASYLSRYADGYRTSNPYLIR